MSLIKELLSENGVDATNEQGQKILDTFGLLKIDDNVEVPVVKNVRTQNWGEWFCGLCFFGRENPNDYEVDSNNTLFIAEQCV